MRGLIECKQFRAGRGYADARDRSVGDLAVAAETTAVLREIVRQRAPDDAAMRNCDQSFGSGFDCVGVQGTG